MLRWPRGTEAAGPGTRPVRGLSLSRCWARLYLFNNYVAVLSRVYHTGLRTKSLGPSSRPGLFDSSRLQAPPLPFTSCKLSMRDRGIVRIQTKVCPAAGATRAFICTSWVNPRRVIVWSRTADPDLRDWTKLAFDKHNAIDAQDSHLDLNAPRLANSVPQSLWLRRLGDLQTRSAGDRRAAHGRRSQRLVRWDRIIEIKRIVRHYDPLPSLATALGHFVI
jgi:hypothetical protein